ncbi:tRNA pseudouridine synthase A [anaerobic digester metagenome]
MKVALKVAYIGTDFHGFQRQLNFQTVEGELIKVFKKVGLMDSPEKSGYSIAGRTDKGVHALGNVVSFNTDEKLIVNQINDLLPQSIRILASAEVPSNFIPRFAIERHYRYVFMEDPFKKLSLDIEKMKHASKIFEGTHDFHNLSKKSERSPVRTINSIEVSENNGCIVFDVWGKNFLWNMVRKMVNVLLMVGTGGMDVEKLGTLLNPNLNHVILPAPPENLILMDVVYKGVKFHEDRYAKNNFLKTIQEEYLKKVRAAAVEMEIMQSLNLD